MIGPVQRTLILGSLLVAQMAPAPAPAQEPDQPQARDNTDDRQDRSEPYYPPIEVRHLEEVDVQIIQVEVTVRPRSGDAEECREIGPGDFEVLIKGAPREVIAADPLGDYGLPLDTADAGESDTERALQYVVLFDLAHLDSRIRFCGRTMPLAFSYVKEMLAEQYRPGDKVMLATYRNWPQAETPWLQGKSAILTALDRLEVGPNMPGLYGGQHRHDVEWIDGWMMFLEALGHLPGRKNVIYLGDDICVQCTSGLQILLPSLGARAQSNHVLFQTVDTLGQCRMNPGVPRDPDIIAQLATMSGGRLYGFGESATTVVKRLREMQPCKFRLSVRGRVADSRKRGLPMRVILHKRGFRLMAPERIEDVTRTASAEEKRQALYMLSEWGHGLFAQGILWPLSPTGRKKRWHAMVMARVRDVEGSSWPEESVEVVINVMVHKGGKLFGEFQKVLHGDEVDALRSSPDGKEWMFPVEVGSGAVTVSVTASATGTRIGASNRSIHPVPAPPKAGEIHSWFLADPPADAEEHPTPLPSAKGEFPPGKPPMILGYGCPPKAGSKTPPSGVLVREADGVRHEQPATWLDVDDAPLKELQECRWVISRVDPSIEPGVWSFHSRSADGDIAEHPDLNFRILARAAPTASPDPVMATPSPRP